MPFLRIHVLYSVFFFALFFAFNLKAQVEKDQHLSEHISHELKAYQLKLGKKSTLTSVTNYGYEVIYHRIHWEMDPAQPDIYGEVTTYFNAHGNRDSFYVDLDSDKGSNGQKGLKVDSIKFRGQKINFNHYFDVVSFSPTVTFSGGETDSFTIWYSGSPQKEFLGSFERSTHSNTPVLWTLSQPYGAKNWWPCKQSLSDKIDSIDLYISVPDSYKVGSNGILKGIFALNNNYHTYHWSHRYPIATYLVAVSVTNYDEFNFNVPKLNGVDSFPVLNYVYPENLEDFKERILFTKPVMSLFQKLFGEYPYHLEKYGHMQTNQGGGMEHSTMSSMGSFGRDLLSHELAHQWFGNWVTCGSWRDLWLNEGFATYLTGLTYRYLNGPNVFLKWRRNKIQRITSKPWGSVISSDTVNVWGLFDGRLAYDKGSFLLYMLHRKLGDSAFYAGCKNFLREYSAKNGFATSEDFIAVMEDASGVNLESFFERWLFTEGVPHYIVSWTQQLDDVELKVEQETRNPNTFYPDSFQVRFYGGGDSLSRWYPMENKEEIYSFSVSFEIDSVDFNPEYKLLSTDSITPTGGSGFYSGDSDVKVFPNPSIDGSVIVVYDWECESENIKLNVIRPDGKESNFKRINEVKGIRLKGLSTGLNFLRLACEQREHWHKVIITDRN